MINKLKRGGVSNLNCDHGIHRHSQQTEIRNRETSCRVEQSRKTKKVWEVFS